MDRAERRKDCRGKKKEERMKVKRWEGARESSGTGKERNGRDGKGRK